MLNYGLIYEYIKYHNYGLLWIIMEYNGNI